MQNPSPEAPNHSDYPLSRVSSEVGESLLADAKETGIERVMSQAEERLSVNNPELYMMVAEFLQGSGVRSPEAITAARLAMIMTHELLRRQAETDSMATQFEDSENPGA